MKSKMVITILLTFAGAFASAQTVEEKKARNAANEALAEGMKNSTTCGHTIAASFDWAAYDKMDWKKFSKNKNEEVPYLKGHLNTLGDGLKAVCADADYKEALKNVKSIQIVPANALTVSDKVVAKAAGSTLTVTVGILGGTLTSDDWQKGIKKAF